MKTFLKFVVFVAVLAAAGYYGYPHVKKYLAEREAVTKPVESEEMEKPKAVEKLMRVVAEKAKPEAEADEADEADEAEEAEEAEETKPNEQPETKPEEKPVSEIEKAVLALYPMPETPSLLELVDNWNDIPDRAFPRDLVVKTAVEFELRRDGNVIGKRSLAAGSVVTATGIHGKMLRITPKGSDLMAALVDIDATDLKKSIEEGYEELQERTRGRILELREAEWKRLERLSEEERRQALGWTDGSDAAFAPLRASLARGELRDRKLTDIKRWRWTGKETIEETTYETALVVSEVETIFGVFSTEIKALVREGRVEKWVDPVSGQPY